MVYRVYTDAATKVQEGYSVVAFLVLRGNTYIKSHKEARHISNTAAAESIAVGLALAYLVDEIGITKDDVVNVFCDSSCTLKFANRVLQSLTNGKVNVSLCARPRNVPWLQGIYDYIPKIESELTFTKVKAHLRVKNPHCYVDRLAKVGLVTDK